MKKFLPLSVIPMLVGLVFYSFTNEPDTSESDFIKQLKSALNRYNQQLPQEKIYLHLDKLFYKPGDDIWIKAYLRDGSTHKASSTSEIVYVELINPKGSVEKTLHLITKNGSTHGDFKLAANAPGGIYKVRAYTNWMKNFPEDRFFEKEIQVQSVLLPKLLMNLDFERKAYGPGDEVIAKLKLSTVENKPLKNHKFNYVVQIEGKEYREDKSRADEEGLAWMAFPLPEKLKSNDGLLNVMIEYEGAKESIARSIPIVLNNISLEFFPEGGDLIRNVKSQVAFKALNELGKPADIGGVVVNDKGAIITEFKSYHQGMGSFSITPEDDRQYFARITQPVDIKKEFPLPKSLSKGYRMAINTDNPLQIQLDIHSPIQNMVTLVGQTRGNIYFSKETRLEEGSNKLTISTADFPVGVVQLTLFDHYRTPRCERLFFANQHKDINIKISTDKEKYLPREPVEMTVQVNDEDGLPLAANLSLAVVDDKLISFADDKQDNIMSYLLLSSDVKGKIEEPNFYFKKDEPKAKKALDYLLLTQGWRRFEWAEILETSGAEWKSQIGYSAEKAVVHGIVVRFKNDVPIENAKVIVLETEEFTYTDKYGKFEFENLDLSIPLTLQATTDDGFSRMQQINNYSIGYQIGKQVTGQVIDSDNGEPIPGANVIVKGTAIGTVTDLNGNFILDVPSGRNVLVFSYIGYTPQEAKINQRMAITMAPDITQLQENVVMAYGMARRGGKNKARRHKVAKVEAALPEIVALPDDDEIEEAIEVDPDVEIAKAGVIEDTVFQDLPEEEIADGIFNIAEEMPEPKGGIKKFKEYVSRNIDYPRKAMRLGIEGKVFIQFIVGEDGTVTDVSVLKGIGAGCDEEAVRVVRGSSDWNPGKQRGRAVKTRMVVPITFSIDNYIDYETGLMLNVARESDFSMKSQTAKYYRARRFYTPKYESTEPVEVRTDFRQTIFWEPNLMIDKTGEAKITFYNSDDVSTFRATVEGIATNGGVGRQEYTYYTQLPFSLNTKIPAVVSFEDELNIPITLKNNTDQTIKGILKIEAPESFQLLENSIEQISVNAGSTKTITTPYKILPNAGINSINISFDSQGLNDSFEQIVEIMPKGFPVSRSFSGKELSASYNLEINALINNSLRARLTVYPDVLSDLMRGIESILREPHGCFEQTSSSTYPNILALQYMEESGSVDAKIKKKALTLIDRGYNKLTAFETKNKGYEWFGNTPPHEGLTAYGLMEFKDMHQVYASVDPKMIARTSDWLLNRRDGKGGFKQSNQALDQFGRASADVSNAYIVYALSECGVTDIENEFNQSNEAALEKNDSYALALTANASFNLNKKSKGSKAIDLLIKQIDTKGFGELEADHSITKSYGKSLQVETASLIVLAILKSERPGIQHLQKGVNYIVSSRSNYGGFGATQATILALKALTEYAKFAKKTNTSGTVEVYVDKQKVASKYYAKGAKGEILIDGLEKFLSEGSQVVTIKFEGTDEPLPYALDVEWSTYTPDSQAECKVELQTALSSSAITLGETVRLTSTVRNLSKEGLPMTVALIGIPSGLSPQPWQLKQMQETKKIDYYEIKKNHVILYFRQMIPEAVREVNLDLKSEITGSFESPASSAYLYYTNEFKSWDSGERILIE